MCYFSTVLEGQLRNLMDRVEDINQEAMKFNRYQIAVARQNVEISRYLYKRVIFIYYMFYLMSIIISTIFLCCIECRK